MFKATTRKIRPGLIGSFVLIITLSLSASCSGDGEVLAEWDNGDKITRGEFRDLIEVTRGPEAIDSLTVDEQNNTLKNFALMKITGDLARKEKLQDSPDFKLGMALIDESASLAAFNRIFRKTHESGDMQFWDMQILFLAKKEESRTEEANDLLKELNSGKSEKEIEEIIRNKNENQRYAMIGGYLDPHCISCGQDNVAFLTDPLKEAEDGKFILVENDRGAWIVRKIRSYEAEMEDLEEIFYKYQKKTASILKGNIESTITDPKQKQAALSRIPDDNRLTKMAKEYAGAQEKRALSADFQKLNEKLRKEKKLEITEAASGQTAGTFKFTPETVLFRTVEGDYTYGDLVKPLVDAGKEPETQQVLRILHGVIIPYTVLKDHELMKQAKQSETFTFIKKLRESDTLSRIYLEKNKPDYQVSEEDMRQWYDLRKNNEFKGKSYSSVKGRIKNLLEQTKAREAFESFQNKLIEDHNLVIHRKLLKPGEV